MLSLEEIFQSRRDTRHFSNEAVPEEVIRKALEAGHAAPSVGLTDATRFYLIRSTEVKLEIKKLFEEYNQKASDLITDPGQKSTYSSLKLEGILDAPLGLVVAYDRSVLNDFTIGTIASNETIKFSAVCAVQNIWLSLTEQGYSMGWVSILNYYNFKKILNLPDEIEALGYFCVGKPATNYDKQPMLQQLGWKKKSPHPVVVEINAVSPLAGPVSETTSGKQEVSRNLEEELQHLIDNKTKPLGSLGVLEDLAKQIGLIQNTIKPRISRPHIVVFAADHGIAQHGVSAFPPEVTSQMVNNFLTGGAAVSVFCRQHQITLKVVDAGVNYDFPGNKGIIDNKIAKGTQAFLNGPAMSREELQLCLQKGAEVVSKLHEEGCNTIGFGEMGIGNTSSASVLMSMLCNIPIADCAGKGTGLLDEQLKRKIEILELAIQNYSGDRSAESFMAQFGGFEILQIAGAMLEAEKKGMIILVDGFICTSAFLCAYLLNPAVKKNAIFAHQSDEKGHKLLLDYLKVKPLLHLGMRLGEASGAAVAFPLIESAVVFLNEMASFESASVTNKS
ncbi:nicotinate-nucleotide--dimethylbenzimidazole phosphoribosyltransferase [Desertivirga brevis]|uniref:nicotinate-nucleotide--dimethylbenzimidazole phosphoribosyltransferase n=1 Tax=Desertivirga brevis TaxID=2810310 RepID=UPI001A96A9E6|nr:nicotinate-nucleotide--dimethylbenzimidazole phosphoribosyltransferase [Pedobacter sp. SYSU D00873]